MVAPIHEVPQFKLVNKPSGNTGTGLSLRNVAISNFLFPESKENTVWKGFVDCHYFVSSLSAPHFPSFKNGFEANLRTKIDFEYVGCAFKVTQERVPLKPSMVEEEWITCFDMWFVDWYNLNLSLMFRFCRSLTINGCITTDIVGVCLDAPLFLVTGI